jgi:peptide deformylase
MVPIVTVPDPVLRKVAKPVKEVDRRLQEIISDMTSALLAAKDPEGVGLAAPQIGVPLRMFLIRPDLKKPPQLFINPEITNYSQRQQAPDTKHGVYEGCLSIPHHYSPIKRAMSVTVKYQDIENGALVTKTNNFSNFPAHIIQHEMDHLNGVLFIDHTLSQNSKLYLIKGQVWEEIDL